MKNRCLLFMLIVLVTHCCAAQDSTVYQVRNISKITFWDPGFSYEADLGEKHTLSSHVFNRGFYFGISDAIGTSVGVKLNPGISEQFRYYYNGATRAAKGKRTDMNSMNYISAMAQAIVFLDGDVRNNVHGKLTQELYYVGAAWGIQRNGSKRFSFDLNVGGGYFILKESFKEAGTGVRTHSFANGFTPNIDFTLGFWLNKRV